MNKINRIFAGLCYGGGASATDCTDYYLVGMGGIQFEPNSVHFVNSVKK